MDFCIEGFSLFDRSMALYGSLDGSVGLFCVRVLITVAWADEAIAFPMGLNLKDLDYYLELS